MIQKTVKTVPGCKPLLYWNGRLLLSRGYELLLSDLALTQFNSVGSLPSRTIKRLLSRFRLPSRLLRLDVGPACDLGDGRHCLVCHQGAIYRVDLITGGFVREFTMPYGGRPLQLSRINIPGFQAGIYVGEYFGNPDKGPARIFLRTEQGHWSTAYTFATGQINHVHSIVQDTYRSCLYVLTGDFGDAACIWRVRDNFKSIERIAKPGQHCRACWMQVGPEFLIYATDTQLETNHLIQLDPCSSEGDSPTILQTVGGSSIYSAETEYDQLIFSTAVEPDKVRGNKYFEMFSTRRGSGILSDEAHIYAGTAIQPSVPIFSAAKDSLPFRLFQFGSFQFPAGRNPDPTLIHAYATALRGVDGCAVLLKHPFAQETTHEPA